MGQRTDDDSSDDLDLDDEAPLNEDRAASLGEDTVALDEDLDEDTVALRRAFGDADAGSDLWHDDDADGEDPLDFDDFADSDDYGEADGEPDDRPLRAVEQEHWRSVLTGDDGDGDARAVEPVETPEESVETQSRLAEISAEIISRAPEHHIDPTLDRVKRVLDLLGDPQHNFRVVHVTGTNGKTSTARMIEALVREHGLRTGLFTSPHLNNITERIQIDGEPLSSQRFIDVYNDVIPYIQMVDAESQAAGGPPLSFFEVLTVMAYAAFADAPVDVAVVEVGLGGTWDSTNVADGDVAVITPIAMDHERWLGSSLVDIADNKAGIIKPNSIAISARQREVVDSVLADRTRDVGAQLLVEGDESHGGELQLLDRQLAAGGQVVDLRTAHATYQDVFLPLHGAHQAHNALLALAATEELLGAGGPLGAEVVEQGFAHVTSPGRLEVARTSPTILLDVAHNPHGAEALAAAVEESFGFGNLVGVLAIMADKDAEGILAALEPVLSDIVLTRNSSERCAEPGDLVPLADEIFGAERVSLVDDLAEAIQVATDLSDRSDEIGVGEGTGVLITGSVVTVADARKLLSWPVANETLLDATWVERWIVMAAAALVAARPELTDLDKQIGDDDHGARVTRGFTAAAAKIAEPDGQKLVLDDDIGGVLKLAATTVIAAIGGASGPLYGTALLRAAGAVRHVDLGAADVARLLRAAADGIAERGQVHTGDKTMVDAWTPAAEAAEHAVAAGDDVITVLAAAADAASRGATATVDMEAHKGRAALLGARSVGHMDPGARSSAIVLRAALAAAKP